MEYQQRYLKYKTKYNELKQLGGSSLQQLDELTNKYTEIIAIIEIYNKLFNSYKVYRFRFNNTKPVLPLIKISNKIDKAIELLGCIYTNNYIEDLITTISQDKNKVVYSLRRKSNMIIQSMLLKNNDAIKSINEYMKILELYSKLLSQVDYKELVQKAKMIGALVTVANPIYIPMINPVGLDIIRNESNLILKLIGDEFDNKTDILLDTVNMQINNLFIHCFININKALDSSTDSIIKYTAIKTDLETTQLL